MHPKLFLELSRYMPPINETTKQLLLILFISWLLSLPCCLLTFYPVSWRNELKKTGLFPALNPVLIEKQYSRAYFGLNGEGGKLSFTGCRHPCERHPDHLQKTHGSALNRIKPQACGKQVIAVWGYSESQTQYLERSTSWIVWRNYC